MILSDYKIEELLKSGELVIEPIEESQVEPASVDLKLGRTFLVPRVTSGIFSMSEPPDYEEVESDIFVVPAHGFVLATTMEVIGLPNNLTAFVEGRSSIGRMGLFIQNAGWVDPGFEGHITLELYNANSAPMKVEAGRRICQLVIAEADQEVKNPYRGKYQGQRQATGSRLYMDREAQG
jgi:dCTP deaminase